MQRSPYCLRWFDTVFQLLDNSKYFQLGFYSNRFENYTSICERNKVWLNAFFLYFFHENDKPKIWNTVKHEFWTGQVCQFLKLRCMAKGICKKKEFCMFDILHLSLCTRGPPLLNGPLKCKVVFCYQIVSWFIAKFLDLYSK